MDTPTTEALLEGIRQWVEIESHTGDRTGVDRLMDRVEARYRRYRAFGPYTEVTAPAMAPPPSRGLADRLRDLLDPTRWSMGTPLPGSSRRDEPPAHEEV